MFEIEKEVRHVRREMHNQIIKLIRPFQKVELST